MKTTRRYNIKPLITSAILVLSFLATNALSLDEALIKSIEAPVSLNAGELLTIKTEANLNDVKFGQIIDYTVNNEIQSTVGGIILFEAEDNPEPNAIINSDTLASGGKNVTGGKRTQYICEIPIPQNNNIYVVWVKAKGRYVSSRVKEGEEFKQLNKSWKKSDDYSWRSLGKCGMQTVGEKLYFGGSEVEIDQIALIPYLPDRIITPEEALAANVYTLKTNASTIGKHNFSVTVSMGGSKESKIIAVDITDNNKKITDENLVIAEAEQSLIPLGDSAVRYDRYSLFNFMTDSLSKKLSSIYGLKFNAKDKLIALRSKQHKTLPDSVTLPLDKKVKGLTFLLSEYWQGDFGKEMACLTIHYADGETEKIPLREEYEIAGSLKSSIPGYAIFVAEAFSEVSYNITLFTWKNERPDVKVNSIVFANDTEKRTTKDENELIPMNLTRISSQILLGAIALSNEKSVDTLIAKATEGKDEKQYKENFATVDYNNTLSEISPEVFSISESYILKTDNPEFEQYHEKIKVVSPKILRIHEGWTPRKIYTKEGFDEKVYQKFITGLKNAVKGKNDWQLNICINWIPGYIDPKTPEGRKLYADMCADLVKRVNIDEKMGVKLWAIYNEVYFKKIEEDRSLWIMYNEAAKAMKAVDPTIMTGGYEPCWPSIPMMRDFYEHCNENVDFITWHKYLTGSNSSPTDFIMSRTPSYGEDVVKIREMVNDVTPGKKVKLGLTEYNINWNWKPHDPRQATHVGAVWLASVYQHLLRADLDMSTLWHSRKGGTFGIFDANNKARPNAKLMYLMNHYVKGNVVESKYTNKFIEVFGFEQNKKQYGLLVINKSKDEAELDVELLNMPKLYENIYEGNTTRYTINEKGLSKDSVNIVNGQNKIHLGAYEVQLYLVDHPWVK